MIKVNQGQTVKVQIKRMGTITLVNAQSSNATLVVDGVTVTSTHKGTRTYGPYPTGGVATITANTGSVEYARGTERNTVKPVFSKAGDLYDSKGERINAGQSVGGGGSTIADTLVQLYEAEQSVIVANSGASFLESRTLTADETPVITASGTVPGSDSTDPASKRVVLCGNAGFGNVEQDLNADERAYLPRWIAGYNQGLRARWRFTGYTLANVASSLLGDAGTGNAGNNNSPQFRISNNVCYTDFILEGDVFYFQGGTAGAMAFSIWVNDKLVTVASGSGITLKGGGLVFQNSANNNYFKIKFPSVSRRRIRIAQIAAGGIGDIFVRGAHTIRPRFEQRLPWLHFGDSFGSTTGGGDTQVVPVFGSGQQMAALFGRALDFVDAHLGGSGWGAAQAGTPNFLQRLDIDFPLLQPVNVITIAAAQNDSAAQIAANAPTVFAGLRARFPSAPIFIAPTYAPTTYGTIAEKIAALRSAAATVPGVYVFDSYPTRVQDRVIDGTGREGNTTGNGTADRLVSPDNVHPSYPAGHREWGSWFADQIYAQCLRGITV